MALTKEQKNAVVSDVTELLNTSKMTIVAKYRGVTVKSIQSLRKSASGNGTMVRVVKNRLVIQALKNVNNLKDLDTGILKDQLLYAFNSNDEAAPAQALSTFAKSEPNLQFVGAITADGTILGVEDVKALANLPGKDQLRAQLLGTLSAPLSGFAQVLSGNVRGVLNVLNARAESL